MYIEQICTNGWNKFDTRTSSDAAIFLSSEHFINDVFFTNKYSGVLVSKLLPIYLYKITIKNARLDFYVNDYSPQPLSTNNTFESLERISGLSDHMKL